MGELHCKPLLFPRVIRIGSLSIRQLLQNERPVGPRNLRPPLDLKGRLGWLFTAQYVMRFGGEMSRIAIQQRIKAGQIKFVLPSL